MPDLARTIKKVANFANLETGWRFGKGGPISAQKIEFAKRLLEYGNAYGIERFNVFAGEEGELMVSFYYLEKSVDLTLETNKSVTFAEDEGDEQIAFTPNLTPADSYEKIWQFAQLTQELFTQKTMTMKEADSKAYLSNLRQMAVSPSLTRNVVLRQAGQSVHILPDTMTRAQAIPQFTGKFQNGA